MKTWPLESVTVSILYTNCCPIEASLGNIFFQSDATLKLAIITIDGQNKIYGYKFTLGIPYIVIDNVGSFGTNHASFPCIQVKNNEYYIKIIFVGMINSNANITLNLYSTTATNINIYYV